MTIPLGAKKWLLNERKHQQKEDDRIKKSLVLSKSLPVEQRMKRRYKVALKKLCLL
jgi:hypothetical protein